MGGQSAFSFLALAPADPEDPVGAVQARALVRVRVRGLGIVRLDHGAYGAASSRRLVLQVWQSSPN